MAYNPRSEFVELYFNGEYQGVYELYQHLEVGPEKVDVEPLDPDLDVGADIISGGWWLELDRRLDEDVCWTTARSVPVCSKDPELDPAEVADPNHPSSAQFDYITTYLDEAEAALETPGDGYEQYFDVDAMIDWYLVSELMKNRDSRILGLDVVDVEVTKSVFLHKQRGGLLSFGPLWDFDLSAGDGFLDQGEDARGWWVRKSVWFGPVFEQSSFGGRVHARWCALRADGTVDGIPARIDAIVDEIGPVAIEDNSARWPEFGGSTHQEQVDRLADWLMARADWMDTELQREFGACPTS